MVKGFSKMYNLLFFEKIFFCKHFYYIFANLQIFLQILKVEHKSSPMMYHLSYLDIKHGIQRGILVFKYLSRVRVKRNLCIFHNLHSQGIDIILIRNKIEVKTFKYMDKPILRIKLILQNILGWSYSATINQK